MARDPVQRSRPLIFFVNAVLPRKVRDAAYFASCAFVLINLSRVGADSGAHTLKVYFTVLVHIGKRDTCGETGRLVASISQPHAGRRECHVRVSAAGGCALVHRE